MTPRQRHIVKRAIDRGSNPEGVEPASPEDLDAIRRKLATRMSTVDGDVRSHPFAFEVTFAGTPAPVLVRGTPAVVVRAQLRGSVEDALYRWQIRVDYHLPMGANGLDAATYAAVAGEAAEMALWAGGVVQDHAWRVGDLRGEES